MNKRAAELPMNTIIIVVLVVIVLIAVGIFFFMQFSKGVGVVGEASGESATGGEQLKSTLDWGSLKATCQTPATKTCGVFCAGSNCAGATTTPVSSCSVVGCAGTCKTYYGDITSHCGEDSQDRCVAADGWFAHAPDCTKMYSKDSCTFAGCSWK